MNSANSTVITVAEEDGGNAKKDQPSPFSLLQRMGTEDLRKLIHSIKVGIALVLVSLLYLLGTLYDRFGDNAIWSIMTVVVVFEFTAGATLSKGLNRGIGTVLGGGLGCLVGIMAQNMGRSGKAITIGISVFIIGASASYSRLVPSIKKKHEYGAVIFILTFNLVAVSGFRDEEIVKLASTRLSTILMGFVICLLTSLFICPVWASDELHRSLVSKFDSIALSLEECLEYSKPNDGKIDSKARALSNGYISVLHSKSVDETLANFAIWEPWHGKFGFSYPWNMYLKTGEMLRQLAASILALSDCLQSRQQASLSLELAITENYAAVGEALTCVLRELGDSIYNMKRCKSESMVEELRLGTLELTKNLFTSKPRQALQGSSANEEGISEDELAITSCTFLLMKMVERVEHLIKEVEELGDLAGFPVD